MFQLHMIEEIDISTFLTVQHYCLQLFNTNFGINFALYCISGQNFRKALRAMCKPHLRRRETTAFTGKPTVSNQHIFWFKINNYSPKPFLSSNIFFDLQIIKSNLWRIYEVRSPKNYILQFMGDFEKHISHKYYSWCISAIVTILPPSPLRNFT